MRTVTAEDDEEEDVTLVNSVKISHSEAVAALNASLQWAEEQNFEIKRLKIATNENNDAAVDSMLISIENKVEDPFKAVNVKETCDNIAGGVTEEDILSEITDEIENNDEEEDDDDTDPSQYLLTSQKALLSVSPYGRIFQAFHPSMMIIFVH
ncbi:hypothetical protein AVEN_200941-1 [Araneus ventricosus]|uniref:Uncharacterized protein n=1 Tax=Araneus ventricosus TaxID=182803 RepID=A0A4Y2LVQ7_ARAVE|nr:hypothetical protein AVEN_200941-1 [Araneus ventricosus]